MKSGMGVQGTEPGAVMPQADCVYWLISMPTHAPRSETPMMVSAQGMAPARLGGALGKASHTEGTSLASDAPPERCGGARHKLLYIGVCLRGRLRRKDLGRISGAPAAWRWWPGRPGRRASRGHQIACCQLAFWVRGRAARAACRSRRRSMQSGAWYWRRAPQGALS